MADGPLVAKIGTVTKERPVLRFSTGKGTPFVKFSIKEAKPFPLPDGWEASYYNVTAFNTLAEHIAQCLDKGDRVGVIGIGEVQKWTDKKTGEERTAKGIIARFVGSDLTFCGADIHREGGAAAPSPLDQYSEEPF